MTKTPMIRAKAFDSALNDARDILDNVLPVNVNAQMLADAKTRAEMRAEIIKAQKALAEALATIAD